MKILKPGDLSLIKRTKRFECRNCGCIFQADKDEYKINHQYNEEYAYCQCPFCHKTVYGEMKND